MKYENKHTIEVFNEYGLETIKAMKGILIKNSKRASGNLINSIDYEINIDNKNRPMMSINFAPYGQFVAGRDRDYQPGHNPKWLKKGPPVGAIKQWLRNKSIAFNSLNRGLRLKGKNYNEKIDIMAFLIIRKIKKRKTLNPRFKNPTDFINEGDKILNSKSYLKDLEIAQKKDIEMTIRKMLKK